MLNACHPLPLLAALLLAGSGCVTHAFSGVYAGDDAGLSDGSDTAPDGAMDDAGLAPDDAGSLDAGPVDAGSNDAGVNGGAEDAGVDAGSDDAGIETDGGTDQDAGPELDAGVPPGDPGSLVDAGALSSTKTSVTLTRNNRRTPVVAHVPAGTGPFPVILLCPAFQTSSDAYDAYANHWASHGFMVVRSTPPNSLIDTNHVEMTADVRNVLDWALDPTGPLAGKADPDHVGIIGHSLGGKVGAMVAFADSRITAYFGIDPVNAGSPISGFTTNQPNILPDQVAPLTIPMGFLGETLDSTPVLGFGQSCAPASGNFLAFRDAATGAMASYAWEIPGAGHMEFVSDSNSCGVACFGTCHNGTVAQGDVQAATRWLSTAFFQRYLMGDPQWDSALSTQLPAVAVLR